MATTESPRRRTSATSLSGDAECHEHAIPSEATTIDASYSESVQLMPSPLSRSYPPPPPPPPPTLTRPNSLGPLMAAPSTWQKPDASQHHGSQSSGPNTPRPLSHRASHGHKRPHPPPPPPQSRGPRPPVPIMLLHPPPPPPPPPPSNLDAAFRGRGLTKVSMQRSLSPSMSLSSGSWHHEYTSSDDDTSSVEADYFEQKNRVVFPPLMPTVQDRQVFERERKHITDSITDKVSRLENSRSSVPSLVDSDASSVASMASLDDGVQELWVQMKHRRQRVNFLKQDMAGRRKVLRDLRRRKDEADNNFMNMLRPILVKGRRGLSATSDQTLETRFAEMQALRTEYHTFEVDYEELEVSLDEEEEGLNNTETRFFSLLAAGSKRQPRPRMREEDSEDDESEEQPDIPYELTGISRHGPSDDAHPLWQDLVSAIGDLNNAKEEYDDLLLYHRQYTYSMDVKKSTGMKPSAEEVEFMDEYPEEEREKREDMDRLTEEVSRLKRTCEENGAMKKHPSFEIAHALDPTIGEDMALDNTPPRSGSLAHGRFSELLSRPDHVLRPEPVTAIEEVRRAAKIHAADPATLPQLRAAQKELGISRLISEFKEEDKSDFITRWLLQQLRTSLVAVELLYSTFIHTLRLRIGNVHKWQQDVLYHWWRDGAVKSPKEFFGPLTGSGMVSPRREASPEHTSLPPEREVRISAPSRAATEDWSSGNRRIYPEEASRSTEVH
ncbi:hypothetical protein CCUS01_06079 [Colletotrichum cuscutae]|uniref:Uncharacterized protein n=1 Tax=Colletotrichum cuscutae TaxID=1209917 RepID=A0AAI9VBA3_9PEZI|nr:hypothetical protein CCUS01_06079 [Colletotrichum cuscutae]